MIHRRRGRNSRVETLRLDQVVYCIPLYFLTCDIFGKITNVLVCSTGTKEWGPEV